MSTEISGMKIPSNKYKIFVEILDKTGGRFVRNPVVMKDVVEVHFTTNNYSNFCRAWNMVNRVYVEIDSPWYKRAWRRFVGAFK